MASTYSTNLKLQLMATGENTGTWGSVTNTNLGTALEEAIVGSVDVTFASADVTLSLTNTNANQTARNMRLVLVGVSGGARQLVVPAIEKIYIVKNELADTCTVKVSGQTGVAVPAGKTMWLCNDGTDVKDVVTHLSSLTLASALPVGSGGTGATTLNGLTFTGENITNLNASNISSGTLANARTTASSSNGASTIVARDASGNFSANTITATISGNATNVSGTVAIANGGTGATDSGTARTNLGLGSMATQNSSSVSISGGSITGITDLAVADGGTGASDSGTARTNLDVPSRSGSGASGTWGINISGNAATASSATNATNATNATTSTTQSNGNNTTAIATTAYVQNMAIGWNQSWQDVTSSRAIGTTYTNSTGKPIMVVVWGSTVGPSANFTLTVGGVVASFTRGDSTNGGATSPVSAIVPNGSTYVVTGNRVLEGWSELR